MSAVPKKPPPTTPIGRRPSTNPSPSASLNSRGPSPTRPLPANGLGRTRSVRGSNGTPASARAAAKRPGAGPSNLSNGNVRLAGGVGSEGADDDAQAETVALIDELKTSLHKAETASEEYRRQASVLQTRLDDALHEQGKLEEQLHDCNDRVAALETDNRDSARRMRDMEALYQSERVAMIREKDEQDLKGEEMQAAIRRLKEAMAQKDLRMSLEGDGVLSRSRKTSFHPNEVCAEARLMKVKRVYGAEHLQTSRTAISHRRRLCTAAIRRTIRSWSCKRTGLSRVSVWNWQRRRSRWWRWRTRVAAECMSWRRL